MKIGTNVPVTIEPETDSAKPPSLPNSNASSPTKTKPVSQPFAKDTVEITPLQTEDTKPVPESDKPKPWYYRFIPKTNSAKIKLIAAAAGIATGVTTALLVAAFAGPALPLVILIGLVAAGAGANVAVTAMAAAQYGHDSDTAPTPSTPPNPHFKSVAESDKREESGTVSQGPHLDTPKDGPKLRSREELELATDKPVESSEPPKPNLQDLKDAESLNRL